MKNTFCQVFAVVAIALFSIVSHAQVRQTHLYIDDGYGKFSILSAPLGGGALTLPGSTLVFPAVNAAGVLLNDGLGTLTWSGASAALTNPMSALGDMIYENATPAPARLPGNTTTATMFLSQTGNGTVSAAPAWSAFADYQASSLQFICRSPTGMCGFSAGVTTNTPGAT